MNRPAKTGVMKELRLIALPGIPEVRAGDAVAELILAGVDAAGEQMQAGDVIVIAQKIVSKAEGRCIALDQIEPSRRARELAQSADKDARVMELLLRESRAILRVKPGIVIAEHNLGFVMANAGIDRSNLDGDDRREVALLLPADPDASAQQIRAALQRARGVDVGVIINDSFGRAWRNGVTGVAIGVAGIPALVDLRGQPDRAGRELKVTQIAAADELAAAASLMMGQAAEGLPVILARGFPYPRRDLFR
jgi:coenzyme F420-0:L-glutamate ligase/coenzyme F420-1:gamma-L-glutamate ligase